MSKPLTYFCSTNSGHQHSTEWEAENCSDLHASLRRILSTFEDGYHVEDIAEDLYDDVRAVEAR